MNATRNPDGRRLPLAVLVALVLAGGALVGLVALLGLNWLLRSEPFWSLPTPPTQPGRPEPLEIVKIALTIVAGVGGLVALTVGYRRQLWLEADAAGHRERQKALHDRYGAAVTQLGHDSANVRLAGVYALANLADEWSAQRQQCVDVLCAYLRVPWDPDPDERHLTARKVIQSPGPRRTTITYTYPGGLGESEVRRTIVRTIAEHLRGSDATLEDPQPGTWSDISLDFTGALLPESNFHGCVFGDGNFRATRFMETANFFAARFNSPIGFVNFEAANFYGSASFGAARFECAAIFADSTFHAIASFPGARFRGVMFAGAKFLGPSISQGATSLRSPDFEHVQFDGNVPVELAEYLNAKGPVEERSGGG